MKPEEEELLSLLNLCFETQKTLLETTIRKLKKYDPKVIDDDLLGLDYTRIMQDIEDEKNKNEETYEYVFHQFFNLWKLHSHFKAKKEAIDQVFDERLEKFLKEFEEETHFVITPEVEEEARILMKEHIMEQEKRRSEYNDFKEDLNK